jgi:hypothetical protein
VNRKNITEQYLATNAEYIKVKIPICSGDDDLDYGFPLRKEESWEATIGLCDGRILDWPEDKLNWRLFVKVVDQGTYTLLDSAKKILIEDKNSYVPNKLLPPTDGFGDYLEFEIEAGFIKNWYKNINFSNFIWEEFIMPCRSAESSD